MIDLDMLELIWGPPLGPLLTLHQPAGMVPPEGQVDMALTLVITADPPVVEAGGSSAITVEVQGADVPADYVITLHADQGPITGEGTITIHRDALPVDVEGTADGGTLTKTGPLAFTFSAPA